MRKDGGKERHEKTTSLLLHAHLLLNLIDLTDELLKVTSLQLHIPPGSTKVSSSVSDLWVGITWATWRQSKIDKVATQQELQDVMWDGTTTVAMMTPWVGWAKHHIKRLVTGKVSCGLCNSSDNIIKVFLS